MCYVRLIQVTGVVHYESKEYEVLEHMETWIRSHNHGQVAYESKNKNSTP